MILKTIKTVAEAGILGIEFVTTDKAITEVIIGNLHNTAFTELFADLIDCCVNCSLFP